jgi:hypothetical protein
MTISSASSGLPNEDGVRYERVDDLTINVYVEGPGDTTVRPPTPARVKQREADRENIERFVAWAQREQEKLSASKRELPNPNEPSGENLKQ